MEPLKIPNALAQYNAEIGIAYIKYRGNLDGATTTAVYDWLGDLIETVGFDDLFGEVFDFTDVEEFMPDNLMQARKHSRRYNFKNNVRKLPVAMVVSNHFQEEILRGPMKNVEENPRKTIVWSLEEAVKFIEEWHARQQA